MRKVFPNSKVRVVALIERNPDETFTELGKVDDAMRRTALDSWREQPYEPEQPDE